MMDFVDVGNPWFWATLALVYLAVETVAGTYFFLSGAISTSLIAVAVFLLGADLARDGIWFILGLGAIVYVCVTIALRRMMKPSEPQESSCDPNEY